MPAVLVGDVVLSARPSHLYVRRTTCNEMLLFISGRLTSDARVALLEHTFDAW